MLVRADEEVIGVVEAVRRSLLHLFALASIPIVSRRKHKHPASTRFDVSLFIVDFIVSARIRTEKT